MADRNGMDVAKADIDLVNLNGERSPVCPQSGTGRENFKVDIVIPPNVC